MYATKLYKRTPKFLYTDAIPTSLCTKSYHTSIKMSSCYGMYFKASIWPVTAGLGICCLKQDHIIPFLASKSDQQYNFDRYLLENANKLLLLCCGTRTFKQLPYCVIPSTGFIQKSDCGFPDFSRTILLLFQTFQGILFIFMWTKTLQNWLLNAEISYTVYSSILNTKLDSNCWTLNFRCLVLWTARKLTNARVIYGVTDTCIFQVNITVSKIFPDFSIPMITFKAFQGLENFYIKFQDFQYFSRICTNPDLVTRDAVKKWCLVDTVNTIHRHEDLSTSRWHIKFKGLYLSGIHTS